MSKIILPKDLRNEVATVERDNAHLFNLWSNVLRPDDGQKNAPWGTSVARRTEMFREIERDPYVGALINRRKLSVAGLPWRVDPASDDEADQKAAEHWRAQFKRMDINTTLFRMMDALLMGFHVHEIMWTVDDEGYIAVDRLVPKAQSRFVFAPKSGGITGDFDLRLLTRDKAQDGIETPHMKFMVHRYPGASDDPYGDALGAKLYWHTLFKRAVEEYWVRYLERFGMPLPWGNAAPGASERDKFAMLQMLKNMAQNGAAVLEHNSTIKALEVSGGGAALYQAFTEFVNHELSALVLGMAEGKNAMGATASAATTVRDVGQAMLEGDVRLAAGTINSTILPWGNEMNGLGRCELVIEAQLEEDLTARATRDKIIVDMGFRPDAQYINDTYGGNWTEKAASVEPPLPLGEGGGEGERAALGSEVPTAQLEEFAEKNPPLPLGDAVGKPGGEGKPPDELSPLLEAVNAVPDLDLMAQLDEFVEPALKIVQGEASFTEMQQQLTKLYPKLTTKQLQGALAQAAFTAQVYGRVQMDGAKGAVEFANPYHDETGKFASAEDAVKVAGSGLTNSNESTGAQIAMKIESLDPSFEVSTEKASGGSVYLTVKKHELSKDGKRKQNRNGHATGIKIRVADHASYYGSTVSVDPVTGNSIATAIEVAASILQNRAPKIQSYYGSQIDPVTGDEWRQEIAFNHNVYLNEGRNVEKAWRTTPNRSFVGNVKDRKTAQVYGRVQIDGEKGAVEFANPYHDERGRFTTGDGARFVSLFGKPNLSNNPKPPNISPEDQAAAARAERVKFIGEDRMREIEEEAREREELRKQVAREEEEERRAMEEEMPKVAARHRGEPEQLKADETAMLKPGNEHQEKARDSLGAWTHPASGEKRVYVNASEAKSMGAKVYAVAQPDGGWEARTWVPDLRGSTMRVGAEVFRDPKDFASAIVDRALTESNWRLGGLRFSTLFNVIEKRRPPKIKSFAETQHPDEALIFNW